jgi:hypothetical protein
MNELDSMNITSITALADGCKISLPHNASKVGTDAKMADVTTHVL